MFVVLYLKFGPKNIEFYGYSYNVGERAVHRAVFAPPPSHQEVINAIYFVFLELGPTSNNNVQ